MAPPLLIDRESLALRRIRAARGPVDFLLRRAAEEVRDRLSAVTRSFGTTIEIGSLSPVLRDAVASRIGGAYRRLGPAAAFPDVVADEDRLPIADQSCDLALSLLSLQFVDDLPGVLVQARRALRPDGLLLAGLIGGSSLTELRQAFGAAEAEVEGGMSPRVLPFADVRDLGGLLQRAGFALPVTDSEVIVVRYDDVFGLIRDLRGMGATNVLRDRRRVPLGRATLLRMAEVYRKRFSDPDGRVRATFEIVWASGWAPSPLQPQPLRPGSARTRLADALGVEEFKAGDKAGG